MSFATTRVVSPCAPPPPALFRARGVLGRQVASAVDPETYITFPLTDLEVIADRARGETGGADSNGVAIRPASKAETKGFQRKAGATGCTLDGTLHVPRAGGAVRLHIMHHDPARVMLLGGYLATTKGESRSGPWAVAGANVSHKIHDFSFGPAVQGGAKGERNPLANSAFSSLSGPGQVRYSLKVVPISHTGVYGREERTHTYASNVGFIPEDEVMRLPSVSRQWLGVDFEYDFTPVMVRYTQSRKSFFEFLTSVCAIVGGIHTVSGLLVQTLQGVSRRKTE